MPSVWERPTSSPPRPTSPHPTSPHPAWSWRNGRGDGRRSQPEASRKALASARGPLQRPGEPESLLDMPAIQMGRVGRGEGLGCSISNIDDAEVQCNQSAARKVISGVVGAASSVTSIQVANLLRLFRIPQVSFFSTSPELSNKQRFEFFSRTIPSDHHQVAAMVEIVKRMNWTYVSIVYEESNYGIKVSE
ncbi:Metabotropic glutamate receptor 3 [Frankliniella fusca]|uniref:Metabotropic glutamate receptor 3 n=1 Tax=Frankliniella fusca TaxID=407009 RepID=A0AAE1HAZ1_9NEOP|nr:Metabotropic glutamate receptor 3 [Frankliniella fusca]